MVRYRGLACLPFPLYRRTRTLSLRLLADTYACVVLTIGTYTCNIFSHSRYHDDSFADTCAYVVLTIAIASRGTPHSAHTK